MWIKRILLTGNSNVLFLGNIGVWFSLYLFFAINYGWRWDSFLCGCMGWSFWEYMYHRFAMHGLERYERVYNILHGYHHMYPKKALHIPIFQYFIVGGIIKIITMFIPVSLVLSYVVGHLLGLFCFESMHSMIHDSEMSKYIEDQSFYQYHVSHHMQSHKRAFCFTSPCFDILMGTFPERHFMYNGWALLPIPWVGFWLGVRRRVL